MTSVSEIHGAVSYQTAKIDGLNIFYREAGLHLLDTGHFVLEKDGAQIAQLMREFLPRAIGENARKP